MRILLLSHAFNSLTQRLFVELRERGHTVSVEFDINDRVTAEAVRLFRPEVVVASFLKRKIPAEVWQSVPCLIVHPGPRGDRGPSALDWAVLEGQARWGVTVLQATADYDAGDVWYSESFSMRPATKGSLYRHEVTEGAVRGVVSALEQIAAGGAPQPAGAGHWRPAMTRRERTIDWSQDESETVLRKLRCGDGVPGSAEPEFDPPLSWFDGQAESELRGSPGALLAQSQGAICRATVDGAVWLGHARRRPDAPDQPTLKLPAAQVLARAAAVPELSDGYRDLWYQEDGGVGWLHFPFYNGALGTGQCRRLLAAYQEACAAPAPVLVLVGGPDFWCNGLHLGMIEAAASPAEESWRNIEAIDDLAQAIITTGHKITIAALTGNAGAGGVFLALAADYVHARTGVVLNPHYKGMGNLYGSEYWTYLLPRRAGPERAHLVTEARLPIGTAEALRLGIIDAHYADRPGQFHQQVRQFAADLAKDPALPRLLAEKRQRRERDEAIKPLERYRAEELARMRTNFFGFDPSYHVARYNFIFKIPKSRTPLYLAGHRG